MASVLIRNLPDEVVDRLKSSAKRNNRSLQQELRVVLEEAARRSSTGVFQKTAKIRERLRKKSNRFSDSPDAGSHLCEPAT